jgi:heat shock protein HtpX
MFKRYILLFVTNILVMLTLSAIAYGVMGYLQIPFNSYAGLMIFCFVLGMGGSIVSLLISKWMAKKFMGLKPAGRQMPGIVQKVQSLSRKAGLSEVPEVYYYDAPEVNAFATGPSRNNSLVAVSTGLINSMNDDEVEAVLAHEVGHIANGDMVTMTLIQGVVNAIVMFFAYIVTQFIMNAMRGDDEREGGGIGNFFLYHLIHNVVYTLLSFLSLPIVMGFSRWREYRADAASAKMVGKHKMIAALETLQRNYGKIEKHDKAVEVMAISSKTSFMELFSSHPSLDKRIKALQSRA